MKIIGTATLVFRDNDTGEITKQVTQENNITNKWIQNYMVQNLGGPAENNGAFGAFIFLSESDFPASNPEEWYVTESLAIGFTDTGNGIISPIFVNGTDTTFPYGEIQQRFLPPVADRTITVVGLTDVETISEANDKAVWAQAWLKLTTPVTQLTTETLDIFYRIQFPYSYYQIPPSDNPLGLNSAQADAVGKKFIMKDAADYFTSISTYYNGNIQTAGFARFPTGENDSAETDGFYPIAVKIISGEKSTHKYNLQSLITIADGLGEIVGVTAWGAGTQTAAYNPWARELPIDNVVQNTFGHSATATKPFFDANQLPTSDATYTIDGTGWTNPDFPKLYRVNISADGAVSASTYNFQVRNIFGFNYNRYYDNIRVVVGLNNENSFAHGGMKFFADDKTGDSSSDRYAPTIIKYNIDDTLKNLIALNKTEIYPFNLKDEKGVMINSTTEPTFTPTNITQVVHDSVGSIYVACRDSGIYKIDTPLGIPSITKIDNTTPGLNGVGVSNNCYGIDIGVGGRLWSMWEGGLFYSDDDGANWVSSSFTNTTITTTYSRVKYIKADPTIFNVVEHRLGIVYESNATVGSGTYMEQTILWWDTTNAAGTIGKQFTAYQRTNAYGEYTQWIANEPWTYFNTINPSPTQNKWGAMIPPNSWFLQQPTVYPTYLDFNDTTYIQDSSSNTDSHQYFAEWELDPDGIDEVLISTNVELSGAVVTFKDDGSSLRNNTLNSTSRRGDTNAVLHGAVCYLGKLIFLVFNPISTTQKYSIVSMGNENSPEGGPLGYLLWDSYGWNGSAWELDHAGQQPTHLTTDALHDGLTIAFDDAGATQSFIDTDYFTTGVCQGVWLDGSTQLDVTTGLYFKSRIINQTALESGTLSAVPRSPEIFERTADVMTWQDANNLSLSGEATSIASTITDYSAGGRSDATINGTGVTDKSVKDSTVFGSFAFDTANLLSNSTTQQTVGLSLATNVLGNAINPATVEFGFQQNWSGVDHPYSGDVSIIEGGVVKLLDVLHIDTQSAIDYEIEILLDGSVNYYTNSIDTTRLSWENFQTFQRKLLYTSPPGTAPITGPYVADFALNGSVGRAGITTSVVSMASETLYPSFNSSISKGSRRVISRVAAGYYMTIGDFATNKGRYELNFFAIDNTQNFEVLIAGVAPTLILLNDINTALAAGEISVFAREGFIRYSAADTGNTITANYTVLLTD